MKIYSYDPFTKIFSNVAVAEKNQLNPNEYILPAFCTTTQPPSFPQGKQAFWNGSAWEIQNAPASEPQFSPEYLEYSPVSNPPPITPQSAVTPPLSWDDIRNDRESRLFSSDWAVLPDSNPPNKDAWLTYRQALRDIPQTFATPESVVWPIKP